jgi:hypothetical protein
MMEAIETTDAKHKMLRLAGHSPDSFSMAVIDGYM